jgi:hypothetical protein
MSVTIGVEYKVTTVNTTATCTCGFVTTQGTTARAIIVGGWHLKTHMWRKSS